MPATLTADQAAQTARVYAAETAKADIVITTALVRGHAPTTITAEMVADMRPGSVIVDLAASGGGNCELTGAGRKVVTDNGVTIIGYTDLASRMPPHTSQLYGTNIVNLLKLLTPGKDGQLVLDLDDVVQRSITVTHGRRGAVAAAAGAGLGGTPSRRLPQKAPRTAPTPQELAERGPASGSGGTRCSGSPRSQSVLAITFSPPSFLGYFTVFVLAVFVGFYVISNVSHSLHTPLMAQTNAISGIILVGALLQLGGTDPVVLVLAFVAATVASINIFGGFGVAGRMIAHVPEGRLTDGHELTALVQAAYLIAGVLFILSLAGLSHQRSAKAGNIAGKIGMVHRAGRDGRALAARVRAERRDHRGADRRRAADRRGDRHAGRPPGRDDADARDDRDPAQFRGSGRGARRLQLLPDRGAVDRSPCTWSRCSSGCSSAP